MDVEEVRAELLETKKKLSRATQDNVYLRTQLQRAGKQMKKKDAQMQQVLAVQVDKLERMGDVGSTGTMRGAVDPLLASRVRALRSELMSISSLTEKLRDLEMQLHDKDRELEELRASVKFTTIRELQIEAETYYEEARRLKLKLDELGGSARKRKKARAKKGGRSSRRRRRGSSGGLEDGDDEDDEDEELYEQVERLKAENAYLRKMMDNSRQEAAVERLRAKLNAMQDQLTESFEQVEALGHGQG